MTTPNPPQQKPSSRAPHRDALNFVFTNNTQPLQSHKTCPLKMQVHTYTSRRTPSNATYSTYASSANTHLSFRKNSEELQRSTSSRSSGSSRPNGYVTLMRKQKATVWCDRAQLEDPRTLARQNAAKMRASREVTSSPATQKASASGSGSLSSSTRVAAKIRNHGKTSLVGYNPGASGTGVSGLPIRLSSTEVEGGDNDDDVESGTLFNGTIHRRTGSGRSSTASSRRGLTYSRQSNSSSINRRLATSSTSPIEVPNPGDSFAAEEGHVTGNYQRNYFNMVGTGEDGSNSATIRCSGEKADSLLELNLADAARLASNSIQKNTTLRRKNFSIPEDLQRRGSVDDRAATMSTVRLYIANPDADSD